MVLQVHVWRLPHLGAATDSSAALVGSVTAVPAAQPFGTATGSLVWTELPAGASLATPATRPGPYPQLKSSDMAAGGAETRRLVDRRIH